MDILKEELQKFGKIMLFLHGKMIDEKRKTCMSHKPCHTGIPNVSGSESDGADDSESEDDEKFNGTCGNFITLYILYMYYDERKPD